MSKLSVYQHWDPLKTCIVGSCWPPEFFSYINDPKLRSIIERIAIETQEDLDSLAKFLQSHNVNVLRPNTDVWQQAREDFKNANSYPVPPVSVRDHHSMIGDRFYYNSIYRKLATADSANEEGIWPGWKDFYNSVRDPNWPDCEESEFSKLPHWIQQECINHGYLKFRNRDWIGQVDVPLDPYGTFDHIYKWIADQGNVIENESKFFPETPYHHGSYVTRLGKDLYFGTEAYGQVIDSRIQERMQRMSDHGRFRTNLVDTGGHTDGTFCPVAPGLILTYKDGIGDDKIRYEKSFPGWEVVYGNAESYFNDFSRKFLTLKNKGQTRWYIPNQENNPNLIAFIDAYLKDWTGHVEETRFFINILMIDPKNAVVAHYDEAIFKSLERHGITCHIMPLRHLFFWDAGTHCVTCDLDRQGEMQNFFPERS